MKPGPRYSPSARYIVRSALFDVDNTLVGNQSRGLPTERFKQAVLGAQGKIKIGLATARPLMQVEHILKYVHAEGLSIVCNGAQIIDSATGNVVVERVVEPEACQEIIGRIQALKIPYLVNDNGEDFFPSRLDANAYERLSDLWDEESERIPAPDFNFSKTFNVVLHNITDAQLGQAETLVKELGNTDITLLIGHQMVDSAGTKTYDAFITHRLANKRDAFHYIVDAEGLSVSETMFVGDGRNDAELVSEAGVGVAMGNSVQETLNAATFVVANREDDGAAIALEYAVNTI